MFNYLERLHEIVKMNSKRIAYKVKEEYITYYDLWERSSLLATSLKGEGILPVVIYGHKSIDMVVAIVACLMANRAYIPVDVHTPPNRIEKIIKICNSTLLISNEEIKDVDLRCMTIDEINKKFYRSQKYDTSSNNIAYIIFTSGTTGDPKGVPISYNNLENFIEWVFKVIPKGNNQKLNILNQSSFSFDLSVADLYYSLLNGYTLVALDKETQRDYKNIFKLLFNNDINLMVVTPTFMKLLMLNYDFLEKNYPKLWCIYFCGEQLEVATVRKLKERFPNIKIINAYGPTEATSAVCAIVIEDKMLKDEYLPVGNINKSATLINIINGEIVLKGKSVFSGYIDIESENYFKEGNINCYKTGDLGVIKNDLLYCFGRKDNQVKYMGYRIELLDIENNLLKIDGISEAVVVSKCDKKTNLVKNIKAFITVEKNITSKYIKNELRKTLPEYMIPKIISIVDSIPITDNGKYDRKKLMEL